MQVSSKNYLSVLHGTIEKLLESGMVLRMTMQCKYQGLLNDAMKIAIKNCQCTELHSMNCLIYKFVCKVDYKRAQDCSGFLKKTLTFDRECSKIWTKERM